MSRAHRAVGTRDQALGTSKRYGDTAIRGLQYDASHYGAGAEKLYDLLNRNAPKLKF